MYLYRYFMIKFRTSKYNVNSYRERVFLASQQNIPSTSVRNTASVQSVEKYFVKNYNSNNFNRNNYAKNVRKNNNNSTKISEYYNKRKYVSNSNRQNNNYAYQKTKRFKRGNKSKTWGKQNGRPRIKRVNPYRNKNYANSNKDRNKFGTTTKRKRYNIRKSRSIKRRKYNSPRPIRRKQRGKS